MRISDFDYYTIRDHVAGDIRRGVVQASPDAVAASVRTGARVAPSVAAEFAERFFFDLKRHLERN